jgi:hypothetical protein
MKQDKKLETLARHVTPVSPPVPVEAETTPRLPIRRIQSISAQANDQVSSLGNSKSASTKAKEQQGTQENNSPARINGFSIRKVRDKPAELTTSGAAEKQVQTAPFEAGAEPTLVRRALSESASVETQAYRAAQREKNRARRKAAREPQSARPTKQQKKQQKETNFPSSTVRINTVPSRRPIAAEISSLIARARVSEREVLRLTTQCHLATGTGKRKLERQLLKTRRSLARTERVRRVQHRLHIRKAPFTSERERKFNREQKKARVRWMRGKFGRVRTFVARERSIQEGIEGWLGSWEGGGRLF